MHSENIQSASEEVSLRDILEFFKRGKKLILIWCVVGLIFASTYIAFIPRIYEVSWLVKMAQFQNANVEEPLALAERLRTPTTFPMETRIACGYSEEYQLGEYLDGALKVNAMKGTSNGLEMKFRASSLSRAKECADAIVIMLMQQQKEMINARLSGRHEQLVRYQHALNEELNQLEKRNNNSDSFLYLVRMDRIKWLRTLVDQLQEEEAMSQLHPVSVLSPIYMPSTPVSPKVRLILILGVLLGLMMGTLNAGMIEYRSRSVK